MHIRNNLSTLHIRNQTEEKVQNNFNIKGKSSNNKTKGKFVYNAYLTNPITYDWTPIGMSTLNVTWLLVKLRKVFGGWISFSETKKGKPLWLARKPKSAMTTIT